MLRPRPTSGPATSSLATIAETEQPILIEDDDARMTGGSAGSASADPKATTAMCFERRPALKVPLSSRPKAVLKSAPSAVTRVPSPVERYVVPRRPAVAPNFRMAEFPMILPGLPSSIASSPATTLAPATPTSKLPSGQLPSAATTPKPMGPPPAQSAAPKPKAPSKEQVQIEVDTIVRETEEKRAKRTSDEQQLHDAMLAAIFKAVFEDTVPENYAGIYSSGRKNRMGCEIPKVIEFRGLPENVQDDLMRAEILPTMWPRYRISGYERLFHYRLMTVMRRDMLYKATCPPCHLVQYVSTLCGTGSIGTGSIHWCTLPVGLQNRLINWSLPPLSVQSRFSMMPVPLSQELTSSTPTSWTCFCSRTWALVASLRSSLAG